VVWSASHPRGSDGFCLCGEREREKREGGGGIVLVQCNRASFLLLRVRFSALLASLLAQPHDDDGTITVAELSLLGPEVNRVPVGPAGAGSGFHRWDDVVRMCTGGGAPHAPSCGGDADAPCRCQRAVCHLSSASVGFFLCRPPKILLLFHRSCLNCVYSVLCLSLNKHKRKLITGGDADFFDK
jgi:hypothetical protein